MIKNWRQILAFWPLALLVFSCVALDQWSKMQAQEHLIWQQDPDNIDIYVGKQYNVFSWGDDTLHSPGWSDFHFALNMRYSRNKGAAFGMLANAPAHLRVPFFHLVSVVVLLLLFSFYYNTEPRQRLLRLSLLLILSGAIGNTIDRNRLGYVIDFIDVRWTFFGWRHDFAIFNVADIAINIGVFCFICGVIAEQRYQKKLKGNEGPPLVDAA